MTNVLISTTKKEGVDKLIEIGTALIKEETDRIHIVNIGSYEMYYTEKTEEGEALDYMYAKALEFSMKAKILRSNDIEKSLEDFIDENQITHVVMEDVKNIRGLRELKKKLIDVEFILM